MSRPLIADSISPPRHATRNSCRSASVSAAISAGVVMAAPTSRGARSSSKVASRARGLANSHQDSPILARPSSASTRRRKAPLRVQRVRAFRIGRSKSRTANAVDNLATRMRLSRLPQHLRGRPHTQPSPRRPEELARALTEPYPDQLRPTRNVGANSNRTGPGTTLPDRRQTPPDLIRECRAELEAPLAPVDPVRGSTVAVRRSRSGPRPGDRRGGTRP